MWPFHVPIAGQAQIKVHQQVVAVLRRRIRCSCQMGFFPLPARNPSGLTGGNTAALPIEAWLVRAGVNDSRLRTGLCFVVMAHSSNGATRTIGALLASSTALLVVLGCGAPAPTANAPTTTQQAPPAAPAASPPAQPSASPAAKPSQAPSPAAASTVPSPASVAASAVASPSSPVAASAADQGAAVNAPLVL